MVLMAIAILLILGLTLGSFVNALIWRLYQQSLPKKKRIASDSRLSITKGRSMCMSCGHELGPLDLVPVVSWLWLRGKCRYCKAPIPDTPVAELVLPVLFLVSYAYWPKTLQFGWNEYGIALFGVWLLVLTCFLALTIYDIRWYRLPDRIVMPLTLLAIAFVGVKVAATGDYSEILAALGGVVGIAGLFWLLSIVSKGAWIGWGDVKLAVSLGLLAGTAPLALLVIFIASLTGTVSALPQVIQGRKGLKGTIPFGPHLMGATIIVVLWGSAMWGWYMGLLG